MHLSESQTSKMNAFFNILFVFAVAISATCSSELRGMLGGAFLTSQSIESIRRRLEKKQFSIWACCAVLDNWDFQIWKQQVHNCYFFFTFGMNWIAICCIYKPRKLEELCARANGYKVACILYDKKVLREVVTELFKERERERKKLRSVISIKVFSDPQAALRVNSL